MTLGDDSADRFMELGSIGGAAVQQVEPLFRSASVLRIPRGNVAGECVFTVAQSHASRAAAATFLKGEYARINGQGSLVLTEGATTLTMANAVCSGVTLAGAVGLRWWVRYAFGITTIT